MASINLTTNRKEIEIIRDGEKVGVIYFSPSDTSIIARLNEAKTTMENTKINADRNSTMEELIAEMKRVDGIIRDALDYSFGYPVSDVVFGSGFTFSTADGVSAVEQFLDGAMDYIKKAMSEEAKKAKARQDKYLKNYKK